MALTKAEFRTAVREVLYDPDGKFWTDSNLDRRIELVLDSLYGEMLDVAPYFNSQYQQFQTLNTPGYLDLRLSTYGGNLTQRIYRIQQVVADGRQYFPKDPRDFLMFASTYTNDTSTLRADTGIEQRFSYQLLGSQMWMHPLGQQTTFTEFRYSYKPTRFTQLTNGYIVSLPEGSELAAIDLCAGSAMTKGNREDYKDFMANALFNKTELLASIRRQYHGMTVPFDPHNTWEWGGQ